MENINEVFPLKVRVISAREEIPNVSPGEQFVHMTFRPSAKDILMLVDTCPKLQEIHVPQSQFKTVAESTKMFLALKNVALKVSEVWGARTDYSEYVEIAA